ncbi:MAG: helix-turn-helix transcriptional regulator [Xanthomonadales bacterium]|nr:helix-turn-helix transcriptional regulator [Xanthomonadales bacterium]
MELNKQLTDDAVCREIGERISRRRLDLGLTQAEVALQAGVAKRTLERLEAGGSVQLTTLVRVLRVLDLLSALERALPPAEPRPLELTRKQGKPRQRASKRRQSSDKPWTWAED